ncbi:MAG: DNA polymerase-3 subunit delta [Myxococcota bacterium]|jgi:DNA polymerase-3 subunit delta
MGALIPDLKNGKLLPLYLVYGSEELLKREAVDAISKVSLQDSPRDFNEDRLIWSEAGVEGVIGAARTFPMMGARRLVVVSGCDSIKGDDAKALAEYAKDPSETTTLLFVAAKFESRTALFKAIKKNGHVEKCEPPYQSKIPAWVQGRARDKDIRIDPDAARLLGDIVGNSLAALDESLERLLLYVASGDRAVHVRLADVEESIARSRVHSVFDLTDALGARRADKATAILETMLAAREPPIRILAMVARHFRRLWMAAEALQRGASNDEVGQKIGVHGFFLRDFLRQANMFSHMEYAGLLDRVYMTDKLLKSSRAADHHHMQSLVLDICIRS